MSQPKPLPRRRAQASIKWIRLQEICLSLARPGDIVHVHGSTDLPLDLRAAVSREGRRIDLMMNLLYNKTLDDVIDSLAHEMAHVVLGTEDHGQPFDDKWAALRKSITSKYRALGRLAKAHRLAKFYLPGCKDKAGKPTLDHVERVAARLSSTTEKTVAYLHDLLEDTTYSREQLKKDFPSKIVTAVLDLTRDNKGQDYMTYIRRLAPNPLARRVKIADLRDNLDRNRVIPDEDLAEKLRARYREALDYLLAYKDPQKPGKEK